MITPLGSRAAIGFGLGMSRPVSASGWWLTGGINPANCVAAYQPKGAASLAASYVNLANPGTYDAAPGVAPSFDVATGWAFNGSNQYLTTGVVPAAISWSYIIRYSDANTTGDNDYVFGMFNGVGQSVYLSYQFGGGGHLYVRHCGFVEISLVSGGVVAIAGANTFVDGSPAGTITQTGPPAAKQLYIGTLNYLTYNYYLSFKLQAFAIYNTDISAYVAALTTAMAAL